MEWFHVGRGRGCRGRITWIIGYHSKYLDAKWYNMDGNGQFNLEWVGDL